MEIAVGAVGFETEDISVAELLTEFSQRPIATAPNKAVATAISVRIAVSRAESKQYTLSTATSAVIQPEEPPTAADEAAAGAKKSVSANGFCRFRLAVLGVLWYWV